MRNDIQHELQLRSEAHQSMQGLLNFMHERTGHPDYVHPVYAVHHKLLAEVFEKVLRGEIKKLYVALPPGSAKSTLLRQFCALWVLQNPQSQILRISATQTLSERQSKLLRSAFSEPAFDLLAGYGLDKDNQSAASFGLTSGANVTSAGLGTSIVGLRAGLAVIDDPVSSWESVQSASQRQAAYEWYQSEFTSRLLPDAPIVMVSTRWHHQDLPGLILASSDGDNWTQLRIPMLAEDADDPLGRGRGDRLWPEWYTDSMLEEAQRNPEVWSGLWQQTPHKAEGDFLGIDDLPIVNKMPQDCTMYAAIDLALSEKQSADATVIACAGFAPNGDLYLKHFSIDRTSPEKTLERLVELHKHYHFAQVLIEDSPAEQVFVDMLKRNYRQTKNIVPLKIMPTRGREKMTRAQPFRSLAKMGAVKIVQASNNTEVIRELTEFPFARHDDVVDVCALLGQHISKMTVTAPKIEPTAEPIEGAMQMVNDRLHTRATLDEMFESNRHITGHILRI